MKVIYAKKPTRYVGRVCLNCGTDLSNRRVDARFCCLACSNAYRQRNKSLQIEHV